MELSIVKSDRGEIAINLDDASYIGANAGDVISLTHTETGTRILGIMGLQSDIESGTVGVNPLLLISNGLKEGIKIDTNIWKESLAHIDSVELGIENLGDSKKKGDVLQRLRMKETELVKLMKNKVFRNGTSFILKNLNLQVTINSTKPELAEGQAAQFNGIRDFSYTWSNEQNDGYDSVLMIDLSGSMDTEDMRMDETAHDTIKSIDSKFKSKHGAALMERLKDKNVVSRIDGTSLAVLNYSQSQSNSFGLVYFSDEGIPVTFPDGTGHYNAGSNTPVAELGEAMLGEIAKNWHGQTNLADGLIKTIEIAKELDHGKNKMITLLMDGKPKDEEKCLQIINSRIVPRKDMIINTLGYGSNINEGFLLDIAEKTGGKYQKVQDVDELIQIFSELAIKFKVHGSRELLDLHSIRGEAAEIDATEVYCKKCGQHASFFGKHGWWYCDECNKYLEKGNFQNKCIKCKKPLTFLGNSKRWFCYDCNKFDRESR